MFVLKCVLVWLLCVIIWGGVLLGVLLVIGLIFMLVNDYYCCLEVVQCQSCVLVVGSECLLVFELCNLECVMFGIVVDVVEVFCSVFVQVLVLMDVFIGGVLCWYVELYSIVVFDSYG